ncbi:MAG: hypothetical protein HY017_22180 [Betaproteobacteria bacterium]|nr:hypothetical protein [Betaproteobacteria bacterium]
MIDRQRRTVLGGLGGAALYLAVQRLFAAGQVEKGVYSVRGEASINGRPARPGMDVLPGDTVITGRDGEVVFVIAADAMLVRGSSRVEISGGAGAIVATGARILTGALLSVFAPGQPKVLRASTATIGIRGTGIYIESDADRTYVCTCYGEAELAANSDPAAREIVRSTHHDQPRYVMATGAPQMLMTAPVINHTDAELTLLESLQGRKPPFADSSEPRY